jgi:hypothetical protein
VRRCTPALAQPVSAPFPLGKPVSVYLGGADLERAGRAAYASSSEAIARAKELIAPK